MKGLSMAILLPVAAGMLWCIYKEEYAAAAMIVGATLLGGWSLQLWMEELDS